MVNDRLMMVLVDGSVSVGQLGVLVLVGQFGVLVGCSSFVLQTGSIKPALICASTVLCGYASPPSRAHYLTSSLVLIKDVFFWTEAE